MVVTMVARNADMDFKKMDAFKTDMLRVIPISSNLV
jgi:hypothetical protein